MLFDFIEFIDKLRSSDEKKEIIEKYELIYGPIIGQYFDQVRYKEYVSKFTTFSYELPLDLENDFDWDLLCQLVSSSYSSEGTVDTTIADKFELLITVASGEKVVIKKVSELRAHQIIRLFEIFVEEQINLQILISEEGEKESVEAQRISRLNRRNLVMQKISGLVEEKNNAEEKKAKLDDLYSQL